MVPAASAPATRPYGVWPLTAAPSDAVVAASPDGREVLLAEGDSFLFDSLDPHRFRNPRDQVARVLWIMGAAPPEPQL